MLFTKYLATSQLLHLHLKPKPLLHLKPKPLLRPKSQQRQPNPLQPQQNQLQKHQQLLSNQLLLLKHHQNQLHRLYSFFLADCIFM